jgi:hypothetical protein
MMEGEQVLAEVLDAVLFAIALDTGAVRRHWQRCSTFSLSEVVLKMRVVDTYLSR